MESSLIHLKPESFKQIFIKLQEDAILKLVCSLATSGWLFVFGASTHFVYLILILISFDTVTGVWKAAQAGNVSSRGFFKFAAKILVYFILLGTAATIDRALPVHFSLTVMGSFLAITEGISILENVSLLGFPVPERLMKTLKDYNALQPVPKQIRRITRKRKTK